MNLQNLTKNIEHKKQQLDTLRPLPKALIKNLQEWYRVELTYTSNALEGNTLTRSETALVVEKGITISGKNVKEHLEAINHAHALDFIMELATKKRSELTLNDILDIHRIVLRTIDDEHAGRLRRTYVGIAGSTVQFPDPVQLPDLMHEFMKWLTTCKEPVISFSAQAHFKLVSIHPFVDGNGLTARLLMNLLLIQEGYPPAIISPNIRKNYIDAIQLAESTNTLEPFLLIIAQAIEASLDHYLHAASKTI